MNQKLLKKNNIKQTKVSRVLLINTPRRTLDQLDDFDDKSKYYMEVYPPLGLMYLSSALKKNIKDVKIKILDLHLEGIKRFQKIK